MYLNQKWRLEKERRSRAWRGPHAYQSYLAPLSCVDVRLLDPRALARVCCVLALGVSTKRGKGSEDGRFQNRKPHGVPLWPESRGRYRGPCCLALDSEGCAVRARKSRHLYRVPSRHCCDAERAVPSRSPNVRMRRSVVCACPVNYRCRQLHSAHRGVSLVGGLCVTPHCRGGGGIEETAGDVKLGPKWGGKCFAGVDPPGMWAWIALLVPLDGAQPPLGGHCSRSPRRTEPAACRIHG